jgi:ABC-type methionine transport system ATPase subunit
MDLVGSGGPAQACEAIVTLLALERVTSRRERGLSGQRKPVPVRDASLEVDDGEVVAILGRGRSGRSTVLRLAAGIEEPAEGRVLFDGRMLVADELLGMPDGIGFCHRRFSRVLGARVVDHVAASLLALGLKTEAANARADQTLARVGVQGCADMDPSAIDYGELVRVSVARALAAKPRLLLVEDPTYGVDLAERDDVLKLLRSIAHDDGLGVLFSGSSGTELAGVDRCVTIDAGELRGELQAVEGTVHRLRREDDCDA